MLPGCATREGSAILGGTLGGAIGSRFGGGNGNTVATGVGAVVGAITGDRVSSSQPSARRAVYRPVGSTQQPYYPPPSQPYSSADPDVERAYARGRADRALAEHQDDMRRAYEYGRGSGGGRAAW